MDIIDYREKLGISHCDKDKQKMFISKIYNFLDKSDNVKFDDSDEYSFCSFIGTECHIETPFNKKSDKPWFYTSRGLQKVKKYLDPQKNNFNLFLSTIVMLANFNQLTKKNRDSLISTVKNALSESHIGFDVFIDDDSVFIFPKGAKELDNALINEPLEWLNDYPESKKEFISALKAYSTINENNASDIADKFRKALEQFFRDFFKEKKTLDNMLNT